MQNFNRLRVFLIIAMCLLTNFNLSAQHLNGKLTRVDVEGPLDFNRIKYPNVDHIKINNEIALDSALIEEYVIFEPVDNILYSANFKNIEGYFTITLFEESSVPLEEWIRTSYSPYINNEDNFSIEFNAGATKIIPSLLRVTVKVDNYIYNIYFLELNNYIAAIELPMESFLGVNSILKSIILKGNILQTESIKADLEGVLLKLDKFQKPQEYYLDWSIDKLLLSGSDYYLPWIEDVSYMVAQDWGANDNPCVGACSHLGLSGYAYDFSMPEGDDVLASSSGVVKYVKGDSNVCGGIDYLGLANYVTIYHDDGKATEYHHLQSVTVTENQTIQRGEKIGTSGKTGFTQVPGTTGCAAHLHFQKQVQGGQYTQSEAFYFAEYPNATPDGELQYGSIVTSQNTLSSSSSNFCSGQSVMVFSNYQNNLICGVSTLIYLSPNARITGESRLYIE